MYLLFYPFVDTSFLHEHFVFNGNFAFVIPLIIDLMRSSVNNNYWKRSVPITIHFR